MFRSSKTTVRSTLILVAALNLSGCVTTLKYLDLGGTETEAPQDEPISVDTLLSQARGQTSSQESDSNLYLRFDSQNPTLTSLQEKSLLDFAKQKRNTLFLACAPSQHNDPFTAASIAIKRCTFISGFLSDRSYPNEIMLAPGLQPDQVRVYR
ncbi:hypothetical protein [Neptuniibacter caesariensis]|uniref:Uncharacterized protein n=1 Tax=Neptuniibacter caesariensis TaxID=207954 RepID=A0A7U8C5M7_NEPCE|nr:hypothetical protein [Neptuniibacter caesariensis]EAR62013.1 hypothetical protein MED92_09919 [Oceanospirillum sp. MED92] [Neptuniibacter caesariensis]